MIAVMECPLCHGAPAGLFHERVDKRYGARTYFRCATCRLIFLQPGQRLAPADEKARYDTHENKPDDPGYLEFLRRLADPVLERVRPNSEGLDYGSGPGPAMQVIFAEHGHSVVNYDPFYAHDPSVLEREYDFVTCSETVEHFYRPDEEFQRMVRLLYRTDAVLGVMTEILLVEGDFADWWYHVDPTHVCFYQRATLEWIASWLGLEIDFPVRNVVIFSR